MTLTRLSCLPRPATERAQQFKEAYEAAGAKNEPLLAEAATLQVGTASLLACVHALLPVYVTCSFHTFLSFDLSLSILLWVRLVRCSPGSTCM